MDGKASDAASVAAGTDQSRAVVPGPAPAAVPAWVGTAVWRGIWQLIAAVLLTAAALWFAGAGQRPDRLPGPGPAAGVRARAGGELAAHKAGLAPRQRDRPGAGRHPACSCCSAWGWAAVLAEPGRPGRRPGAGLDRQAERLHPGAVRYHGGVHLQRGKLRAGDPARHPVSAGARRRPAGRGRQPGRRRLQPVHRRAVHLLLHRQRPPDPPRAAVTHAPRAATPAPCGPGKDGHRQDGRLPLLPGPAGAHQRRTDVPHPQAARGALCVGPGAVRRGGGGVHPHRRDLHRRGGPGAGGPGRGQPHGGGDRAGRGPGLPAAGEHRPEPAAQSEDDGADAGVAFAAAMAGGAVGGFIGAFFALPIAAVIQAFLSTYTRRYDVLESDLTRVDEPKIPKGHAVQE